MCGRFTRNYTWAQIHSMYSLVSPASNLQPRFNICPTTNVDVVIRGEGPRALVPMRWGLIPGWWKKPLKEMRLATFNARAETVAEKPSYARSRSATTSAPGSLSRSASASSTPNATAPTPCRPHSGLRQRRPRCCGSIRAGCATRFRSRPSRHPAFRTGSATASMWKRPSISEAWAPATALRRRP